MTGDEFYQEMIRLKRVHHANLEKIERRYRLGLIFIIVVTIIAVVGPLYK